MFRPVIRLLPLLILPAAAPASAYVGPGLGAGALGVIFGFIGSILLAIFAVLWFPIKRIIQRRKDEQAETAEQQQKPSAETHEADARQ